MAGRVREHVEGLEAEVNVLRCLDHPNIVRYLVRRLHDCSKVWHALPWQQAGGRALECVEDLLNGAWLLRLLAIFSTVPDGARPHARGFMARISQPYGGCRLAVAPSLLCQLTCEKSFRLCVMEQGTDRDEEHLNIFLEFVPGGSIASLLTKFGKPLNHKLRACHLHLTCCLNGPAAKDVQGLRAWQGIYGKAFA